MICKIQAVLSSNEKVSRWNKSSSSLSLSCSNLWSSTFKAKYNQAHLRLD